MRRLPAGSARRAARGVGVVDGLIALAILAFGLLGMTRLQTRALSQGSENLARVTAVQFADELAGSVLIDTPNAACYTIPAAGACGSTQATTITTNWKAKVEGTLPGGAATSTLNTTTNALTVAITWTGKESGVTHRVEATTDVR